MLYGIRILYTLDYRYRNCHVAYVIRVLNQEDKILVNWNGITLISLENDNSQLIVAFFGLKMDESGAIYFNLKEKNRIG